MFWNDSCMWGLTGSRTSRSGQFSSATFGMTRETDFPAWTIRIWRSNIRWKGKTWQNICGETSGCWATNSKSSGGSRSNSFVDLTLLGVFGVFGVTGPISVIKNWIWSATCSFLSIIDSLPCRKWSLFVNSSSWLLFAISFEKKTGERIETFHC